VRPAVLLIATLLVLPAMPSLAVAAEPASPEIPAWVAALLEARGVPASEWDRVQVERRVLEDGIWRVEAGSLADLATPPRPAEPAVPDAVLGNLAAHVMLQVGRCDGYSVETLAEGVTKVGGSWDVGFHVVSATALPPGVDTADPQGSLAGASVHSDVSVAGVGAVQIQEDRIVLFGTCLALLGTMNGPGVFAFGHIWPA
jgi:hypothetical protein